MAKRQNKCPQGDVIKRSVLNVYGTGTADDGGQERPYAKGSRLKTVHVIRTSCVELLGQEAVIPEALYRVPHCDH